MNADGESRVYGPVPSRRLGMSLGINNIPAKVCPYACVYCQVGRTSERLVERRGFYEPEAIFGAVQNRLASPYSGAMPADYLTLVPDGEPTLDRHLGEIIQLLKRLPAPVGVITNAALLYREDVRQELARADWVSLKIDAAREAIWRKVNRPHGELRLPHILDGMRAFAGIFSGKLVTETMLLAGLNDKDDHLAELADVVGRLHPDTAYLSIPTRPPTEHWARPPAESRLNRAYLAFSDKVAQVEHLIGYEGDAFAYSGDVENDILSITAVHPMREAAVRELLSWAGAAWSLVDRLMERGDLTAVSYRGHLYYLRTFQKRSTTTTGGKPATDGKSGRFCQQPAGTDL